MRFVGHGRQLLKFTCLQPRPVTVLNMLLPLGVCGLLTLAVGLVLIIGAGDARPPPQHGAVLTSWPAANVNALRLMRKCICCDYGKS